MTLSEWFKLQGMSITEFARRIGVTHSNASRLINGKSQPGLRTAQRIFLESRGQVGLMDWRSNKHIAEDQKTS